MSWPQSSTQIVWSVMNGDQDRAWKILQILPSEELDQLEDALDALQDLIGARHAAEAVRRAAHESG